MKKILILFTLIIFYNSTTSIGQRIDRIEIGIGFGTNSFNWSIYDTVNKKTVNTLRNKIDLIPVLRMSIQKDLLLKKNYTLGIQPFIGYYTFGGTSRIESNGYKDKIRLNSIELGIIPNLTIKKYFQVGIGLKGQYILKATSKSFGTIDKGSVDSTTWKNYDMSDWFKPTSLNMGLTFRYLRNKYSFGFEYWYGLTNLNKIFAKEFKPMMRETNARLIFTYNLKSLKKSTKKDKK